MSNYVQHLAALGRMASRLSVQKPGARRALHAAECAGYAGALIACSGSEKVQRKAEELQAQAMACLEVDRPALLEKTREVER
ncbi:hypothetical protein QWY84_05475 [Aquisalimonas lutea]|uniref:hypothetical protein n=1 Tax=Aquisalimonas lutea TaxID=1327750 RepID=UPI0025B4E329|nr:hypothetical protein [Aquisalimonas lutea]MDN3517054.1 hypothetical protein [Aquisalimonas lutea]